MLKRFHPTMTFIKSFILRLCALFVCALLFWGCTPEGTDTPIILPEQADTSETRKEEALPGGTLRLPMPASPHTMHPLYVREAQLRNVYSMIFEPLVEFNELMEPVACIAESWKYDASANIWTLQLRANVHWHGGLGTLTGADAAYTINTILSDPESIYYSTLSTYVKSAEGYDNTLIIHPKTPSYALIYALNIPIVPQSYYSQRDKLTKDMPVGSGCFEGAELILGNETKMTLNVFSKWWKKLPYIQHVTATGFSDTQAMLNAFKNGELDCVPTALKTTEIYEILEGVDEKNYLSHNYVFLGFNLARGVFSKTDFRKAVAYAVDRTDIINNVYLTKATGAEQPLFNDSSLSSASVPRYDNNTVLAEEILSGLGYADTDGDGYLDAEGGALTLTLAVLEDRANPVRLEAAEYIRADLKEVGIYVNIVSQPLEDLKATIKKTDYDMILTGYYLSDTPDLDFIFSLNGSGNLSNYSSSAMDAALNGIKNAATLDALKAEMLTLENIIASDLPQIGLFFEMNTFLYTDKLSIGTISRESRVYSTVNTWYFKN